MTIIQHSLLKSSNKGNQDFRSDWNPSENFFLLKVKVKIFLPLTHRIPIGTQLLTANSVAAESGNCWKKITGSNNDPIKIIDFSWRFCECFHIAVQSEGDSPSYLKKDSIIMVAGWRSICSDNILTEIGS